MRSALRCQFESVAVGRIGAEEVHDLAADFILAELRPDQTRRQDIRKFRELIACCRMALDLDTEKAKLLNPRPYG